MSVTAALPVDLARIEAAAVRLAGRARRTPLLNAPGLDRIAGRQVLVKAECLQHTGSFKYRGAWAALSALPADIRGVIACSSGNHAQAVARAARQSGRHALIVMPQDAPRIKIAHTRAHGAEIVFHDRATQDRDALAASLAQERGWALIPPFDHADVIAGQGSVGLEIAAQAQALGVDEAQVLVCCGGGGLASGIALALAAHAPGMRVHTVEPEGFDDVAQSLAQGRIVRLPQRTGFCDAIVTPAPGNMTWPILRAHCGPGLAVSDAQVLAAMALAFEHLKLVVEPGGAVALAAALFHGDRIATETVIVTASGGNVDRAVFARALREGAPDADCGA